MRISFAVSASAILPLRMASTFQWRTILDFHGVRETGAFIVRIKFKLEE